MLMIPLLWVVSSTVDSVQPSGPNPTIADFISTLTVDDTTLVGGSEICCGVLTLLDDCINVTLLGEAT